MVRRARKPLCRFFLQWACCCLLLCAQGNGVGQTLPLPERFPNAATGSQIANEIAELDLTAREARLCSEIMSGNVPQFLRKLSPVTIETSANGQTNRATFFVTPDYLAVGSDADYFLIPLSPFKAQRIADSLKCSLPTPCMVDAIYAAAKVRLSPSPIPPSPAMTTVAVFSNHNAIIRAQRSESLSHYPLGALVAGHKKDVVLSARLASAPGKVAIYGWHKTNGAPIQPLYLGHTAEWVDYSQCIRLVAQLMLLNGQTQSVSTVLSDTNLASVLSSEGLIARPRYAAATSAAKAAAVPSPDATNSNPSRAEVRFTPSAFFAERTASFSLEPNIQVQLNAPPAEDFVAGRKVLLIFYALPNGNTTAQTIGHVIKPGEDWHYDIQHIGAQTRFLRQVLTNELVVVAYLENGVKSWPAWRKQNGDQSIPAVVDQVRRLFDRQVVKIALCGHSGGGSFIFGYLNAVERIPDDVVRLIFLDANYAYDPTRKHNEEMAAWLNATGDHSLCFLAYDDAKALLDGKSFVSAAGGTWGKSHEMQQDLAVYWPFTSLSNAEFQKFSALNGRVQFLLKENPERKVLHTVQVERNGFIHALLTGTPYENKGYEYFGPRAYSRFIAPE
jgi:hypothetical protein